MTSCSSSTVHCLRIGAAGYPDKHRYPEVGFVMAPVDNRILDDEIAAVKDVGRKDCDAIHVATDIPRTRMRPPPPLTVRSNPSAGEVDVGTHLLMQKLPGEITFQR